MDSLRILFIWEWLVLGAPERTLARKVRQLRSRGHSVWLASAGGPLLREILDAGARHLTLPTLSQAVMAPTLREAAADWTRLDELIERERIEIIDAAPVKPYLYAVPVIARRRGIPLVLEAVSPSYLLPRDAKEDLAALFAEGGVVAMEPEWGHVYRGYGIDTDGLRVIPSMVDTEVFRPPSPEERASARAALGIGEKERLVLAVSRFDRDKAPYLERLVDEFRQVAESDPEARLLLAGDGASAEAINARARAYYGGRARRVAGTTDPAQVALWYGAADVFVGRGMAVLEAAACGVPAVVATEDFMTRGRGPGLDGAAVGVFGENGYVGTGSQGTRSTSFSERIIPLLADEERRRALSVAGVRAVREAFNVEAVVSAWEAYYAERLARAASPAALGPGGDAALIESEMARRL